MLEVNIVRKDYTKLHACAITDNAHERCILLKVCSHVTKQCRIIMIILGDGGYHGTGNVMAHQLFKVYPLHTH